MNRPYSPGIKQRDQFFSNQGNHLIAGKGPCDFDALEKDLWRKQSFDFLRSKARGLRVDAERRSRPKGWRWSFALSNHQGLLGKERNLIRIETVGSIQYDDINSLPSHPSRSIGGNPFHAFSPEKEFFRIGISREQLRKNFVDGKINGSEFGV